VFGIRTIPGDDDLRDIVEDVSNKDLERSHRAEGEPARYNEYVKDISILIYLMLLNVSRSVLRVYKKSFTNGQTCFRGPTRGKNGCLRWHYE
jgi:hypothetical protein